MIIKNLFSISKNDYRRQNKETRTQPRTRK